jgi:Sec-independent protein secretion pathway component TatC
MRVSLLGCFILRFVILYEIIAFVVPGLPEKEQRGFSQQVRGVCSFGGVLLLVYELLPQLGRFGGFPCIQTTPRFQLHLFFTSMLFGWVSI